MKNNIAFEMSISDIILLLKSKWKLVGVTALLFILLCSGYKAVSSSPIQLQQEDNYVQEKATYDLMQEVRPKINDYLKNYWLTTDSEIVNDPIFTINPYECKYERLVICFGDDSISHDQLVTNWIIKADDNDLFESRGEKFAKYKTRLIRVESPDDSRESNETVVQVLYVKGFDAKKGADYLVKYFKGCAAKEKLMISDISRAENTDFNSYVFSYQKRCKDEIASVYSSLEKTKNADQYIVMPTAHKETKRSIDILIYAFLGLVLGLVIGSFLVVLIAIRKDVIVSTNQIEEVLNIALLSNCSTGSDTSINVLNANLDVLTKKGSDIMIIAEDSIDKIRSALPIWSEKGHRSFFACTDIFDDSDTIETLQSTEGIVLGIEIGKSKLEQMHRIIVRAARLNQRVLGYVLI